MTTDISSLLAAYDGLRGLDDDALFRLQAASRLLLLAQGELLTLSPGSDNTLYCIMEGRFALAPGADPIMPPPVLEPGQWLTDADSFTGDLEQPTFRAEIPSVLLAIAQTDLRELARTIPILRQLVSRLLQQRLPSLTAALTGLFGDVNDDLIFELEPYLGVRRLRRGEELFHQGDAADSVYVVLSGRLRVSVTDDEGRNREVADIQRGEWIGEMALLLDEARTTTITAVRDAELLAISREGFEAATVRYPQFLLPMLQKLAQRLKSTTLGLRQSSGSPLAITIAVVPLSAEIPSVPYALLAELERCGAVLCLNSNQFNAIHGEDAARCDQNNPLSRVLDNWMAQQEEHHRYIVLETDHEATQWTRRCLRHADRVLFVAHAADEAGVRPVEALCGKDELNIPSELVLLHRRGTFQPKATSPWLQGRSLVRHHHVRVDRFSDIQRVGRLLTGRGTGLVLSGGGARGFAHIGVMMALKDAGIPIDCIGGTSIGAFIASLYAWDSDIQSVVARARTMLVDRPRGFHYTLPYTSLMVIKTAERRLIRMYDGLTIEDLWLDFFCVSTNLTQAEMMVHRNGPLWLAIRATTAVPGLLPPVFLEGEALVDGGVLNNLPIDVMDGMGLGRIIASDVTKGFASRGEHNWREPATLLQVAFNHINPARSPVRAPRASHILTRCLDCTSLMRVRRAMRKADMYFTPPVGNFGLLEMGRIDELIAAGYRYASSQLQTPAETDGST